MNIQGIFQDFLLQWDNKKVKEAVLAVTALGMFYLLPNVTLVIEWELVFQHGYGSKATVSIPFN